MNAPTDQLVTLADASRAVGRSASYFRLLRWRHPAEFPEPRGAMMGRDLYDLTELVRWNQLRALRNTPTMKETTTDV